MIAHARRPNDDFEHLAIAEIPPLQSLALWLCRDHDRASDLVQDTLERALANRHRFAEGTQLACWLRTIMRNLFRDGWRQATSRRELSCALESNYAGAGDGCEDENEGRWRLIDDGQLQAALTRLPEPLRTTFEIHTAERLSYAALGRRLGISPNTAGTRLLRARRRLRALLSAQRATQDERDGGAVHPMGGSGSPPRKLERLTST
jgi:RNA polymerase sigma-70 factor, ECF subfamily